MSSIRINPSEYIGLTFEKLTVIGVSKRNQNEKRYYLDCQCECGNIIRLLPYQIKKHQVKSCGCLRTQAAKNARSYIANHFENDRSKHPLYWIWYQMINRCENQNSKYYNRYGGRGISVCEEWHDFNNFVLWSDSVNGRPRGYSLDRINNDGNYEPNNCRWTTNFQQGINKSSNILVEYKGQTKTLMEWSLITGIRWTTLYHRFTRGWDVDKMLSTPPKINRTPKFDKKISQFDLYGNKIKTYNVDDEVPINCIKSEIVACCNGNSKTYRNYIWKYEGE
jgi:hypothetical protein